MDSFTAQLRGVDWDLVSSYGGLLSLATFSIYAGSYGSLPSPKPSGSEKDEEDDEVDDGEHMTLGDAYLFPIIGSFALVGLYLIVKYFGKEWINWFLGWYFSLAGVGSVWKSSISLLRYTLGEPVWKRFEKFTVIAKKGHAPIFSLSLRSPSLFLLPISVIPSGLYHFWTSTTRGGVGRSALVTDILGLSFSHNALALLKLDSFKTGCILLSGLFVYDIWWVFGTEVMVQVATKLDLPIKILWPKSLLFSSVRGFTMLGLGDIVIPGIFVALALRYDYARYAHKVESEQDRGSKTEQAVPKPYFYAALGAYVAGLMTTMLVMHVFHAAQPALLYLSPACILSFAIMAVARGEFADAWAWNDLPEEEGENAQKQKGDGKPLKKKEGLVVDSVAPGEGVRARGSSEGKKAGMIHLSIIYA
ncbi:signal peptide peptidase-domain-containing protein [Ephemerocybe angulata]|uniref:Signal peptide peptidase-domain-containing protein n=1 Tax=Ephemerocybe angulata TaxID=980116 RepID=A0A8H6I921_9AGAR|nr:signal peptide peptidase-domain-containing protein [Tulosesus angulatus]